MPEGSHKPRRQLLFGAVEFDLAQVPASETTPDALTDPPGNAHQRKAIEGYLSSDNVKRKVSSRLPVTLQAVFVIGAFPNTVTPLSSASIGPLTS